MEMFRNLSWVTVGLALAIALIARFMPYESSPETRYQLFAYAALACLIFVFVTIYATYLVGIKTGKRPW